MENKDWIDPFANEKEFYKPEKKTSDMGLKETQAKLIKLLMVDPKLVNGIGISSKSNPTIKINLVKDANLDIPDEIEGVRIETEIVGEIRAQKL